MKARKKPVEIECVQWDGNNLLEIRKFVGECLIENYIDIKYPFTNGITKSLENIEICTLEGNHMCNINDYIIKGVHGEFYPCKPDIFKETYEIVEE